jgi:hypothetical protein
MFQYQCGLIFLISNGVLRPIRVAARSKARTVFATLNAGIVGSNSTQGIHVCVHLFCACFVLYVGIGLATG